MDVCRKEGESLDLHISPLIVGEKCRGQESGWIYRGSTVCQGGEKTFVFSDS
jgi:hypothetical protein